MARASDRAARRRAGRASSGSRRRRRRRTRGRTRCPSSSRDRRCRCPASGRARCRVRQRSSGRAATTWCGGVPRIRWRRTAGMAAAAERMRHDGGQRWQLVPWGGPPAPATPPRATGTSLAAAGAGAAAVAATAAPFSVSMRATTVCTATVSPSLTRISASTPATDDGNLGIDLVGRDLEDGLVALDLVADLLQPLRQRPLGDRFAHLGHDDVNACHVLILSLGFAGCARVLRIRQSTIDRRRGSRRASLPTSSRCSSRTARRSPRPA